MLRMAELPKDFRSHENYRVARLLPEYILSYLRFEQLEVYYLTFVRIEVNFERNRDSFFEEENTNKIIQLALPKLD